MATHIPDVPAAGYFYHEDFNTVWDYVYQCLVEFSSIRFIIHTSGVFNSADQGLSELHINNQLNYDLDIEALNLHHVAEEIQAKCSDPENYPQYEGSGFDFIGICNWWFKIIPSQLNNNGSPNNRNTVDSENVPEDPDDVGWDDDTRPYKRNNSFLEAVFWAKHSELSNHSRKEFAQRRCAEWVRRNVGKNSSINISEVPHWHEMFGQYNIAIFNRRGNVIYKQEYGGSEERPLLIYYDANTRKFRAIRNLRALFQESSNKLSEYCWECRKFHKSEACQKKIYSSRTGKSTMSRRPTVLSRVVAYADFEATTKPGYAHEPSGYVLLIMEKGQLSQGFVRNVVADNCANSDELLDLFFKDLDDWCMRYQRSCPRNKVLTEECAFCNEQVIDNYVIGRSYLDGVKGKNHRKCWENMFNTLPVYFHNWRGYDNHLVIRKIIKNYTDVQILGKTFEKIDNIVISDKHLKLKFGDTMNFLLGSLDYLSTTIDEWRFTPQRFQSRKSMFPYDWFDNVEKLREPTPQDPDSWQNVIKGKQDINMEEIMELMDEYALYEFGNWHDFYMEKDGWLLLEIFEKFRRTVWETQGVDPVYFQGSPALTWYLAQRMQPERSFDVIKDMDIYMEIQKSIRGGVAQCVKRYVNTEGRDGEYLQYWDINSLYSKCMMYKLPTQLVGVEGELPADWMEYDQNSNFCFLINCNLSHDPYSHDQYQEYPPVPHNFNGRLCTTFLPKENYLVHNEVLKFYMEHGVKLNQVNHVYVFVQEACLKEYVSGNIEARKAAIGNPSYQELYKLLNNSLYGKTCENVFKYRKFVIKDIENESKSKGKLNSWVSKMKNFIVVDDKAFCEEDNLVVKLTKPCHLGFTVLEFAKLEIYRFFYQLKRRFRYDVSLCYTDTDSMLLHFVNQPEHPLLVIKNKFPEIYDKLDFEHGEYPIKTENTYKVAGLWSDEAGGKEIVEFCGLRAKTYCVRFADDTFKIKNKGVTRNALIHMAGGTTDMKINMESYKKALFEAEDIYIHQYILRSKKHSVQTLDQVKLALSSADSKRIVLPDRVLTLPFGYEGTDYPMYDSVPLINQ